MSMGTDVEDSDPSGGFAVLPDGVPEDGSVDCCILSTSCATIGVFDASNWPGIDTVFGVWRLTAKSQRHRTESMMCYQ